MSIKENIVNITLTWAFFEYFTLFLDFYFSLDNISLIGLFHLVHKQRLWLKIIKSYFTNDKHKYCKIKIFSSKSR